MGLEWGRMRAMEPVLVDVPRPGITRITLNRPDKLNAMTTELVEGLHQALDGRRGRSGRAASWCSPAPGEASAPASTCAATARRRTPTGLGRTQAGFAVQHHIARLIPHLRSLPQPVIAAVNGPATGGGFALVLGSDIRIAAATARFNAAFIRIGLSACDIGTSWLLPRLVGAARAHELMLTGRLFDADEAERIGLVTEVVPDDALLDAAYTKAGEIMLNTPFGVALTKEGMWSALEIPGQQAAIDLENRQQIMASFSADHREAMRGVPREAAAAVHEPLSAGQATGAGGGDRRRRWPAPGVPPRGRWGSGRPRSGRRRGRGAAVPRPRSAPAPPGSGCGSGSRLGGNTGEGSSPWIARARVGADRRVGHRDRVQQRGRVVVRRVPVEHRRRRRPRRACRGT